MATTTYSSPSSMTVQDQNIDFIGSQGTVLPTIPGKYNTVFNNHTQTGGQGRAILSGNSRGHVSPLNSAWLNQQDNVPWWNRYITGNTSDTTPVQSVRNSNLLYYGYNNNVRA